MEERLKELGDPSGKQTSEFWNEWFQVVCGEDHRPFEWYCGVDEVIRVLRGTTTSNQTDKVHRMIHPGSGNSLVPVKLRDDAEFPHEHTVVDIADVALQEMKTIHDQHSRSKDEKINEIEYLLGNVLEPPLPLEDSSFDVWVDKGLVDALFKDSSEPYCTQSQALFSEAYRLLHDDDNSALVVVTMAEKHSTKLILDSFWAELGTNLASLHIWELEPVSGDMRPFAFVSQRHGTTEEETPSPIHWHKSDGEVEEFTISVHTLEKLLEEVGSRCDESRAQFRQGMKQSQADTSLATLEIKPYDAETDMEKLKESVVATRWTTGDGQEIKADWCESKIVPIGYGVSKLVLKCIVETDDLDDLADAICDWEGDAFIEDGVQSVDIDWSQTHMIAKLPDIAFPKTK
jgi:translation elongation factor EF-1beta